MVHYANLINRSAYFFDKGLATRKRKSLYVDLRRLAFYCKKYFYNCLVNCITSLSMDNDQT